MLQYKEHPMYLCYLLLASLFLCLPALAYAQNEQKHAHDSEISEDGGHEHDHPKAALFLGADISPAISAEAASKIGFHIEVEFKVGKQGSLVVAGGPDFLFSSSEEKPKNTTILGVHLGYMHHLENIEVGGSIGFHLGMPGIEPLFVVGKELPNRWHIHGGIGVTVGRNSENEQDVLLGPLMFGLGYRLN